MVNIMGDSIPPYRPENAGIKTWRMRRDEWLASPKTSGVVPIQEMMEAEIADLRAALAIPASTAAHLPNLASIAIAFKRFDQELPDLVDYSSSYGGTWTSDWCVVIDHNGDVSMSRFKASESEKLTLDTGNRKFAKWTPSGSWANYKAWAYQSDVRAALAIPASTAATDPVVEANRKLLLERSRVGIGKYGTTLAAADISPTQIAQHALEEALDPANYLQRLIQSYNEAAPPDK